MLSYIRQPNDCFIHCIRQFPNWKITRLFALQPSGAYAGVRDSKQLPTNESG